MATTVMKKQNYLNGCKDWLAFDIRQKTHLNNSNKNSSHHVLFFILWIVGYVVRIQNKRNSHLYEYRGCG